MQYLRKKVSPYEYLYHVLKRNANIARKLFNYLLFRDPRQKYCGYVILFDIKKTITRILVPLSWYSHVYLHARKILFLSKYRKVRSFTSKLNAAGFLKPDSDIARSLAN